MKKNWIFLLLTIVFTFTARAMKTTSYNIFISDEPVHKVGEKFLSVTLGSSKLVHKFHSHMFQSKRFQALIEGLNSLQSHPSIFLRFGGSRADNLVFNATTLSSLEDSLKFAGNPQDDYNIYYFNFTLFNELYHFVEMNNWRLIFDLNSLLRYKNGSWDSRNAVKLIKAVLEHGYSIDYELGNEPDLYPTHRNTTIPPEQLAKDFKTLKNILVEMTGSDSKLYGPDMATLTRYGYFEKFLSNIDDDVLDYISFHHYYSSSKDVTAKNFTSVGYLDMFLSYLQEAFSIIDKSVSSSPQPPVVIGETSSTYGGGNPGVGQSFAASFLWLDKLGLAAQMNVHSVMRQSLKGGYYSLIDHDFNPCVDYWVSLLYKQVVGTQVLKVSGFLEFNRTVRAYAHCVKPDYHSSYATGNAVVLFVLNVKENDVEIKFSGSLEKTRELDMFLFTSATGNLDSGFVKLNGKVLKMSVGDRLPELKPVKMKQPFVLPSMSYAFYIVESNTVNC